MGCHKGKPKAGKLGGKVNLVLYLVVAQGFFKALFGVGFKGEFATFFFLNQACLKKLFVDGARLELGNRLFFVNGVDFAVAFCQAHEYCFGFGGKTAFHAGTQGVEVVKNKDLDGFLDGKIDVF